MKTIVIWLALFTFAPGLATTQAQETDWGDTTGTDPSEGGNWWDEDFALQDAADLFGHDSTHWGPGDWAWFEAWLWYGPIYEPFDPLVYMEDRLHWELTGELPPGWEQTEDIDAGDTPDTEDGDMPDGDDTQ